MSRELQLDGITMGVTSTASNGVVGAGTRLTFTQRGERVMGRYVGGSICRGFLAGRLNVDRLDFHYLQLETSGEWHAGDSSCIVESLPDGRLRVVEHFSWRTRAGGGTNVFEESPQE